MSKKYLQKYLATKLDSLQNHTKYSIIFVYSFFLAGTDPFMCCVFIIYTMYLTNANNLHIISNSSVVIGWACHIHISWLLNAIRLYILHTRCSNIQRISHMRIQLHFNLETVLSPTNQIAICLKRRSFNWLFYCFIFSSISAE